ncbi:MAG: phosphatase PAP2 family protein [bacterium]
MNTFFSFVNSFDKKVQVFFEKRFSTNTEWLIETLALNPMIIYIIFLAIDFIFFSGEFFVKQIFYIFTCIIVIIIKQAVRRERPKRIKGNSFKNIMNFETDNYSFPSAHSFMIAQMIPLSFIMFSYGGIAFSLFAIFIMFSRIYLKFHYLSDVITGAVLGLITGSLILFLM